MFVHVNTFPVTRELNKKNSKPKKQPNLYIKTQNEYLYDQNTK